MFRRPKYSIRHLLGWVVLLCVGFAIFGARIAEHDRQVRIASQLSGGEWDFSFGPTSILDSLIGTKSVIKMSYAGKEDRPLSKEEFEYIASLPDLHELNLSRLKLRSIAAMLTGKASLKRLDLSRTDVDDAIVPSLIESKQLEYIDVSSTHVSGAGLRRLVSAFEKDAIIIWSPLE